MYFLAKLSPMFSQVASFGSYLGLPLCIGRNKRQIFSFIEDKLRHRLGGWRKKILSRAGKEVLIKSVCSGITHLFYEFVLSASNFLCSP